MSKPKEPDTSLLDYAHPFSTFPNHSGQITITYEPAYKAFCRIGKQPFQGTLEISYRPKGVLLEFESFEIWLRSLADEPMTIEELARLTFDNLVAALGDITLSVTVHAVTTVHAPVTATIQRYGK